MRKVFSVGLMVAMLAMVGMTRDASATATVTLLWETCTGCTGFVANTSSTINLTTASTQTARLGIYLTHDEAAEVGVYLFSLRYDTDLGNELNVNTLAMNTNNWAGTDVNPSGATDLFSPLNTLTLIESGVAAGEVNVINSGSIVVGADLPGQGLLYSTGTFSATATSSPYRVAFITYIINGATVTSDGADIFSGLFSGGDNFLTPGSVVIPGIFGTATVNVIPEPGTVSLLGLGLVGLVLAGRRSRRS